MPEDLLLPFPLTPLPRLEVSPQLDGSAVLPEDLLLPFPLTPLPRLEVSPQLDGSAVSLADVALSALLTLSLLLEGLPEDLAFAAPPTFPPLAADFRLCACCSSVVEDKHASTALIHTRALISRFLLYSCTPTEKKMR